MNLIKRCSTLRTFTSTALLLAAACGGDRMMAPTARSAPTSDAARDISDGATGGNKDVWFLPPLVPNPSGKPGYGDPFQNGLPVVFKIVDLGATGTPVILTLPAVASPTDQLYQANWDTKNPVLNPDHNYRVEVWIGSRRPAFADIDVVTSGGLLKNVNTNQYIGLQDGRTLPLKVRVEKNWACINKASCVTEVVPRIIPVGEKFIVKSNDLVNAVAFEGTWHAGDFPVVVTIENIAGQEAATNCGSALTIMRSSNSCIKFTADPPVVLTAPATVATCLASPGDDRQMVLKYDVGETPKFLEDVAPPIVCPEGTSMVSPNASRAMRLASAAMNKVSKAFRWATNTRTAYAIDLGVGGRLEVGDDFSYFTLGLPSTIVAAFGQGQTGLINSVLPIAPAVRFQALHRHGDDALYVAGLNVTCTIVGPSGLLQLPNESLVSAAGAVYNSEDDTYTCPQWKMPNVAGTNTLRISSNRHDAQFYFPNGEGGYTLRSGTFDFTATSVLPVVEISALTLNTSSLYINGRGTDFNATITNTGPPLTGVSLQGWIHQGSARRASGGTLVLCGANPSGVLPTGTCTMTFPVTAANNPASGTGTLTAGAAAFELELSQSGPIVDMESRSVTLLALPNPVLAFNRVEHEDGGDRYFFDVTNRSVYGDLMFVNSAAFPCLPNPVASRTRVEFHNASTNAYIYGYCTIGSGDDLHDLWFFVPTGNPVPEQVYLTLFDQLLNITYTSNNVPIGAVISNLVLGSTTAHIEGPSVSYVATLVNNTGALITNGVLQGWVRQGSTRRAAGGVVLTCTGTFGELAAGICTQNWSFSASNAGAGTGTLVPGAATLEVELKRQPGGPEIILFTYSIPITLVSP